MLIAQSDIDEVLSAKLDWTTFSGKTIVVTGATGMLASYIVESLLSLNAMIGQPMQVMALVRNVEKARQMFGAHADDPDFHVVEWRPDVVDLHIEKANIIIHAASISWPDTCHPVDVIEPNIIGTWNLLRYVKAHCLHFEQFIFISSSAVYGDNPGHTKMFSENDGANIFPMAMSSCYAASKCAGESICMSFMHQYGIPVKTIRYAHTFGSSMNLVSDPRSFVSFVRSIVNDNDIVLTSDGSSVRYFCYATDATIALLMVIINGKVGEAYNIANPDNMISMKGLAELLVGLVPEKHLKVVLNGVVEPTGHMPQKEGSCLNVSKLKQLGWRAEVSIREGFVRVLRANGIMI